MTNFMEVGQAICEVCGQLASMTFVGGQLYFLTHFHNGKPCAASTKAILVLEEVGRVPSGFLEGTSTFPVYRGLIKPRPEDLALLVWPWFFHQEEDD